VNDILKLCAIPLEQQSEAYRLLQTDQNVKIDAGKIAIPDVDELIKQAAFYRKQNSKRANEQR
jgi:anaerobic glycerol-3-phosphate dehydrogenase